MQKRINRPIDPYSPEWPAYWAQNPHLLRGVGADAADGGEKGGDNGGDKGGGDAAELEQLRKDAAEAKALREENELFKRKHAEAEKHRKEQEKTAAENARKAAAAAGDIEALEKSWGEKFTARETELSGEVTTYRGMVEELTAGATANSICTKIAMEGCADGLMPHVRARLKSEIVDGKAVTRILDKDGRVSAMTPDDLMKELKAVPYLAPLIVGSKAGGAGTPGGQGNSGSKSISRADFEKLSPHERAAKMAAGFSVAE